MLLLVVLQQQIHTLCPFDMKHDCGKNITKYFLKYTLDDFFFLPNERINMSVKKKDQRLSQFKNIKLGHNTIIIITAALSMCLWVLVVENLALVVSLAPVGICCMGLTVQVLVYLWLNLVMRVQPLLSFSTNHIK